MGSTIQRLSKDKEITNFPRTVLRNGQIISHSLWPAYGFLIGAFLREDNKTNLDMLQGTSAPGSVAVSEIWYKLSSNCDAMIFERDSVKLVYTGSDGKANIPFEMDRINLDVQIQIILGQDLQRRFLGMQMKPIIPIL